tara:strand:- start:9303 stop:9779 length:477 start_codon:yes stop_codon:yes gene_type:complete
MSQVEQKLRKLGLSLPERNGPVGNYVAYSRYGALVYVSGQTCKWNGKLVYRGAVGQEVSLEEGIKAAEFCALNLFLQLKIACGGDLDHLQSCLKLTVYVNAAADFRDHSRVADGASDLFRKCLGERGQHARAAVGCSSLPGGASVEIDGIFELDPRSL